MAWDRQFKAPFVALTGGLSPISLGLAVTDWAWHLLSAPGTAMQMAHDSGQEWLQALQHAGCGDAMQALDKRYADPAWALWPYCAIASTHHTAERWWQQASHLRGMEHHHEDVVHLLARQWLDMLSPANWPHTNPQVIQATLASRGENLQRGLAQVGQDLQRAFDPNAAMAGDALYRPGVEVACTPGAVVHRNHLVELIQYSASTAQVQREPVFIVPSWIMKYYILDLSPHNSLVRYLVEQGHTVFMLSWRNPDASDALLDMEDYLRLGVLNPLAVITERTGGVPIHAVGYCLGGTLLSIAAAALARDEPMPDALAIAPLASMTLLATQLDFQDAGELGVLLDEAQVAVLEDTMADKGFLTSGGHNAGIVSEPGHAHRSYQMHHTALTAESTGPELWRQRAPTFKGSWWPAWHAWLLRHGGAHVSAREISPVDVLAPAPGDHVQVRYAD